MKQPLPALLARLFLPLLLAGAAASCKPDGAAGAGRITVQSKPDGAAVTCNGQPHGVTPATITGLPAGSHLIRVTKAGFHPEVRSIPLLEGQSGSAEFVLEAESGLLLVHSKPAGAEITVDGASRGQTPALVADLALGEHRLTLAAPGHQPREVVVQLDSRVPKHVNESLESTSGSVSIVSTPPGAEVFIDGRNSGTAPVTVDTIPKGQVRIELRLAGHRNYEVPVTILAGQTQQVTAKLDPIPGSLKVVSLPAGARVYVDDNYRGDAPVTLTGLTPGSYRVRAEVQGFAPMARTSEVRNGEETTEEFRLATNSGLVELITAPAGVEVFLNGKSYGKTSATGTDAVSDPLKIDMLPEGDYTLTLTLKGYSFTPKRIRVQPNQTVALTEKLDRQFIPDTIVRLGDGSSQAITGALIRKHPNGDIEIQVSPGAFRTIPKNQILSVEPLKKPDTP